MSPLFHYSFILCLLVLVSHNIWHRRSLSYLPNPTLPSIIPTPFKSLFPSVSLNGITFLAKECQSLTQLPYQPANNPQALFAPHGMPTFIFASSHRLHASAFAVVGLGARAGRYLWGSREETCLWISLEGPRAIMGTLVYYFPEDTNGLKVNGLPPRDPSRVSLYETVIIQCTLNAPTPADSAGTLFATIHGDEVLIRRENLPKKVSGSNRTSGSDGLLVLDPPTPLPRWLTVCTQLITQPVRPERVLEQIQLFTYYGADSFLVYDGGGVDELLRQALRPYVTAGMVEIVPLMGLSHLSAQLDVLVTNDCLYRTRFTSRWATFVTLEELPFVFNGRLSLRMALEDNEDAPWLSVGSYEWSIKLCAPPAGTANDSAASAAAVAGEEWLAQQMVYRMPTPTCSHATTNASAIDHCVGTAGYRRLLFNPRRVDVLQPHAAVKPADEGVNISARKMNYNRYKGITTPAALVCDRIVPRVLDPEGFIPNPEQKIFLIRDLITSGRASGAISLLEG